MPLPDVTEPLEKPVAAASAEDRVASVTKLPRLLDKLVVVARSVDNDIVPKLPCMASLCPPNPPPGGLKPAGGAERLEREGTDVLSGSPVATGSELSEVVGGGESMVDDAFPSVGGLGSFCLEESPAKV